MNLYAAEITLDFSKTRFAGAEVVIRADMPWSTYLEFTEIKGIDEEVKFLVAKNLIVRWNLEDASGKPLPIEEAALDALPAAFRRVLVTGFIQAAITPDLAPLVPAPASGEQ